MRAIERHGVEGARFEKGVAFLVPRVTSSTPLDLTTPQGTRLTGYGDVTFASGTVRHMFDAVLASNDTDTKFAGEGGRASWQADLTLDVKGFGRVTDLSVAAANDVAFGELRIVG